MKVGLVGIGRMGGNIARRLMRAGHERNDRFHPKRTLTIRQVRHDLSAIGTFQESKAAASQEKK